MPRNKPHSLEPIDPEPKAKEKPKAKAKAKTKTKTKAKTKADPKAKTKADPKAKTKAKAKAKPKKKLTAAQKKTAERAERRREIKAAISNHNKSKRLRHPGTDNPNKHLGPKLDPKAMRNMHKKQNWLDAYATCGRLVEAAKIVGMSHVSYYAWTDPTYYGGDFYDEEFTRMVPLYHQVYLDKIRGEVDRRAIEGWDEPVFGSLGRNEGTGVVGHVRKYSDRLLELRARMNLPEAENLKNNSNVTVDARNQTVTLDGKPVQEKKAKRTFDPEKLTDEQLDAMENFVKATQTADGTAQALPEPAAEPHKLDYEIGGDIEDAEFVEDAPDDSSADG